MPLVAKVVTVDATLNHYIVKGTIATSGSVPASGHGDPLSFVQSAMATSATPMPNVTSVPDWVEVYEAPAAGTSASGYFYNFAPGTNLTNGKVQIFQSAASAAPLSEVQGTAWATLAPQNLSFIAEFPRKGI